MDVKEIGRLCDEFERQLSSDSRIRIEDFVRDRDLEVSDELIIELLRIETEWVGSTTPPCTTEDGGHEPQTIAPSSSSRIPGRYRCIRELGKGGFGRVLLTHDTVLHRNVALKLPRREAFSSGNAKSVFLHEARTAAQMRHPGLVTVHDVDTSDGMLCIVQEFIDGCDLRAWSNKDSISRDDVLQLMIKVAEAVHFAHEAGFIHRDLKPSNILVDHEGQPHVADFGLALPSSDAKTQSLGAAGTPGYMSPEQMQGAGLDRGSDIWSLGVILYELLTSVRPYHGKSPAEWMDRILHDTPIQPSNLDPRIPNTLDGICLKCLDRRRERRFTSAAELARSLESVLNPNHRSNETPRQKDLQSALERRVLQHVNGPKFEACKVRMIASTLGLNSQDEKKQLRTVLQSLASRSLLQYGNDRMVRPIEPHYLRGRLTNLKSGVWQLEVAEPVAREFRGSVMIDFDQAGDAKHGDHVRVCLFDEVSSQPCTGKVIEVIEESSPSVRGTLEVDHEEAWVIVENGDRISLGPACQVAAQHGESVYTDRLVGAKEVAAVLAEILPVNQDREDIEILLTDLDLPEHYSASQRTTDQSAFRLDRDATHKDRLDLRNYPTYSIAELGRGDISNAFSITPLSNKGWLLGVHVTDVSSRIGSGSDLDQEAARRGASVFLGRVEMPMLPPVLSHHWLALKPGEDRLCMTVWLEFTADGELVKTELCPSIICSEHLSCEVADTMLASALPNENKGIEVFLTHAVELASLIRRKRHDHGEFELYRPPLNVGFVQDPAARSKKAGRSLSSQIASELRLAANKAVAAYLVTKEQPFVRRVQAPPGKDRLEQAYRLFRARGIACGNLRNLRDLQMLVERSIGGPDEQIVLQVIRRTIFFRKASYSVKQQGHFGLGVDEYCHFTDPLRRYADIVVQRAVDSALANDPSPMQVADLNQMATICVQAEGRAARASRRFYLRHRLRELKTWKLTQPFDAVIEQVTNAGLQVRGVTNRVGALIPIETLGALRFDRRNEALGNDAGGIVVQIGEILSVKITDIDIAGEQVTAKLAHPLSQAKRGKSVQTKQSRGQTKKRESGRGRTRHRR